MLTLKRMVHATLGIRPPKTDEGLGSDLSRSYGPDKGVLAPRANVLSTVENDAVEDLSQRSWVVSTDDLSQSSCQKFPSLTRLKAAYQSKPELLLRRRSQTQRCGHTTKTKEYLIRLAVGPTSH